jgi:hypothetical protein
MSERMIRFQGRLINEAPRAIRMVAARTPAYVAAAVLRDGDRVLAHARATMDRASAVLAAVRERRGDAGTAATAALAPSRRASPG